MTRWQFIFDTETTGLPDQISRSIYFDYKDSTKYNKSRLVSIGWVLVDLDNPENPITQEYIIKPAGFIIHNSHFHGIEHIRAEKEGITVPELAKHLKILFATYPVSMIVGHNLLFDLHILAAELYRSGEKDLASEIMKFDRYCTMEETRNLLKLPPYKNGQWKSPRLNELHQYLFKTDVVNPHQSSADSWATWLCYEKLME